MRARAAEQDWLTLERLPAYAPELNPVELLWSSSRNVNSPTSPATTSPMLLTPPNKASTASTTTHNSHGHSSPTPDSPSTHHTHRTNEKISSSEKACCGACAMTGRRGQATAPCATGPVRPRRRTAGSTTGPCRPGTDRGLPGTADGGR
ncbi:transposase [Streptomyces sp. NPDC052000]|uniref:transposase n=1 Tax=Streptomyces sp. NPDC052000 TaxID=3155676 RepID=UPI003450483C